MVRPEGRHGICRTATRASRVCGVAFEGNPLLRCATCGVPGNNGLGASPLQVWQYRRRCETEATVRPVLYQERLDRARRAYYAPDHKDGAAGPGSAMILAIPSRKLLSPSVSALVPRFLDSPVTI